MTSLSISVNIWREKTQLPNVRFKLLINLILDNDVISRIDGPISSRWISWEKMLNLSWSSKHSFWNRPSSCSVTQKYANTNRLYSFSQGFPSPPHPWHQSAFPSAPIPFPFPASPVACVPPPVVCVGRCRWALAATAAAQLTQWLGMSSVWWLCFPRAGTLPGRSAGGKLWLKWDSDPRPKTGA